MDATPSPRSPLHDDERGMALALALIAIIVIGALVTGTFFAGRMEMVSGRNTVYTAQASEAAEVGLATAFDPWDRNWNSTTAYPVGLDVPQAPVTITIPGGTTPTKVQYTTTVRRMQGGLYRITTVGQKLDRGGNVLATRILAKFAKLVPPGTVDVDAAVTTKEQVTVGGNSIIDGHDAVPPGWDPLSCGPLDDAAGVRTGQGVSENGVSHTIDGDPKWVLGDTTVTDAVFQDPFYAFLSSRNLTFADPNPAATSWPPTTAGSPLDCNTNDVLNWGEPARGVGSVAVCQDYFPIVYFGGNELKLQGGKGQGILLIANDLTMSGGFEYTGLIIVLGKVKITGTGAKITGALLSNNFDGDQSSFSGDATVQYSGCAINAALTGTATGIPLAKRPWAQLNPR